MPSPSTERSPRKNCTSIVVEWKDEPMKKHITLRNALSRISPHDFGAKPEHSADATTQSSKTPTAQYPVPETARPRRTMPVELDAIRVTERLRHGLDGAKLEIIAASMAELGLQSPILLRLWRDTSEGNPQAWGREDPGLFGLVAGAHRLEAARQLGWTRIEAIIVEGSPDDIALIEIDENLARAELTALDRARFLAARKRIHTRLNASRHHGGDRRSADYKQQEDRSAEIAARSFPTEAADLTDLSKSMIYRAVAIGEGISDDLADLLASSPIADNETSLYRIAQLPPTRRLDLKKSISTQPSETASIVNSFLANTATSGRAKSRPAEDRHLVTLKRTWSAANPKTRRRFLEWQAEQTMNEAK